MRGEGSLSLFQMGLVCNIHYSVLENMILALPINYCNYAIIAYMFHKMTQAYCDLV